MRAECPPFHARGLGRFFLAQAAPGMGRAHKALLAGLERNVYGDSDSGMAPVVHVIPVIHVVDVNVVGFIPGARPRFWPRINKIEPDAPVLESWTPAHNNHRNAMDTKPVPTAKMGAETVFRNAVSPVPSAFAPRVMFVLPMLCALALPNVSRPGVLSVVVCLV